MRHAFDLADTEHGIALSRSADGYRLHLGDQSVLDLRLVHDDDEGRLRLLVAGVPVEAIVATRGDEVFVHLDGEAYALRYRHPLERLAALHPGATSDAVRAPMPGAVIAVAVSAGDAVLRGQTLLVMESMKMETTLAALRDGVIAAVHVECGQRFDRDALLLSLEPLAS